MLQEDYDEWIDDSSPSSDPSIGFSSQYNDTKNNFDSNDGWEDKPSESFNDGPRKSNNFQGSGHGSGNFGRFEKRDHGVWKDSTNGWEDSKGVDNNEETSSFNYNNSGGFRGSRERKGGVGRGGRGFRGRRCDSYQDSKEENSGGGWEGSGGGDWEGGATSDWNSDGDSNKRGHGRGRGRGRGQSFSGHAENNNRWQDNSDNISDSYGKGDSYNFSDSGRGRGRGRGQGRAVGGSRSDMNDAIGDGFKRTGNDGGEGEERKTERYIPPEPTDDENVMFGNTISTGINFDKYDDIQIKVTGENVPQPVSSFEDCQLRKILIENIKKSGYTKPTPVQKHALPIIRDGRDLMACAQTGSGKTAAFLLPMLHNLLENSAPANPGRPVAPQVIICSPTRELAIQIFHEARKFAHGSVLKICIAYGGTVVFHQAQNILRGCNILVATPGRLNDFVEKGTITFSNVQCFVLDEADRMLDMGFLPAVEKMLQHESMMPSGERQTLMFSATFPEDIQRLAGNYLQNYIFLAVGIVGGACSDVEQVFYEVSKFDKRSKLVEILKEQSASENKLTLVFVEQKRNTDFIAAFLCENGFPATSIHGDRLQSQREEALHDFKTGRMPVLVATAVAARGLDIKNVAHVVNFDLPKSIDEYVHRIGRTGRLGNRGRATSFFDSSADNQLAPQLLRILEQTGQEKPAFLVAAQGSISIGASGFEFGDSGFGGEDVRGTDSFLNSDRQYGGARAIEEEEVW